jgi:hypothetical protein
MLKISRNSKLSIGWAVSVVFNIHLHTKDVESLYAMQRYFEVGNVTIHGLSAHYIVKSVKEIGRVIEHFDKYPLKTQKHADFLLFKLAYDIIINKKHLIKSVINLGLPEYLRGILPDLIPMHRPNVPLTTLHSTPEVKAWIAGFVAGEGCFYIKVSKSKTHRLGVSVALNFIVVQDKRDLFLLEEFPQVFGCGQTKRNKGINTCEFRVTNLSHIIDKVIPVFDNYPIYGAKDLEFKDFKEAANIINSKAHLTPEGLAKILLIKSRMNTKRTWHDSI